ncbi:HNH endonuclease signature motif containing protein [Alkalibacillus haloalkaliphilus]|uniref:HNH endonuclease n=1 Tax=Alkalibacillus haloalkaliphilus TaxID=94136 RepID=A0A511W671_9BACI|nr:HNH endonuclease signature motif containing protein [Alkalibacillus haloalkaliphilus]GEN46251.1 HNH endonuclease [Alkalibacillus haloalkaliphilus]
MRALDKPIITHSEVLKSCISNIQDYNLKDRVTNEIDFFYRSSEEYDNKGNSGKLSEIPIIHTVNGNISKEEMRFLYRKLVVKGQPGRVFYDRLLHSSKLCPMCGYRLSTTLDHFLPKSEYPTYAVDPLNLIPCCTDCNMEKGTDVPAGETEKLHPYYDRVNDQKWLFAEVIYDNGIGFRFKTIKPSVWSSQKYNKVNHHFHAFGLSELYSIYASQELNDQAFYLKKLSFEVGSLGVRKQLIEYQKSAEKHYLNNWKSAMYEALGNSEWFCSTGVQEYIV